MNLEDEVVLRDYKGEDVNCISDNWGSSYYKGSFANKVLSPDEFHSFHRPIRQRFFNKENTSVLVCASNDDPWLILGWIATETLPGAHLLHYTYVKEAFRSKGILNLLISRALPTRPVVYTHMTGKAATIFNRKAEYFKDFIYIPNLV